MLSARISNIRNPKAECLAVAIFVFLCWVASHFINWQYLRGMSLRPLAPFYFAILKALLLSVILTAITILISALAGTVLAIIGSSRSRTLTTVVTVYTEIFRSLPLLVTLYWVYFALPRITGVSLNVYVSSVLAMSLQATAYMTEVMKSGIAAVPKGQSEAAAALGLPAIMRWRKVILPQAFRITLPSITNVVTSMWKTSAILSALSVPQLWQVAQQVGSYTFKPLEALTIAALLYYLVGKLFTTGMRSLEVKWR